MDISKEVFKVDVCKRIALDNYETGESIEAKDSADYGIIETIKRNSLDEVVKYINDNYGEPYLFDDRLEVQKHETKWGNEPTENDIERWKKNDPNIHIYNVDYSFYIEKQLIERLENNDLKKLGLREG